MWSADLNPDGVLPGSLCITHDAVWWVSAKGLLYMWRAGHAKDEAAHPTAIAQVDRRVECMAVSPDTSRIALVSSTFIALLHIEHAQRPAFLRLDNSDAPGEVSRDEGIITVLETTRIACTAGDVRGVMFNSEASLAAVCTGSALLLLSNLFGDAAEYDERAAAPYLTKFHGTHLGASTQGCSLSCFTGARQLLIVDDVNHLVLFQCHSTGEEVGEVNEGAKGCAAGLPNESRPSMTMELVVDGHICSRTARVTSLACSYSGVYGEKIVVLGLSNGTVKVLNGRTLKALRTWNVQEAITAVPSRSLNAATVGGCSLCSRTPQLGTRTRLGIPDAAASTVAQPAVTIFDVCIGAHLITVCTSHGVVYYSKFTFQPESAYTQLLATPLMEEATAAPAATAAILGGVAMRGGPNGRWAYTNAFDGIVYFSPRNIDTQHTLEAHSAGADLASEDVVHARTPLPAEWVGHATRPTYGPTTTSNTSSRSGAKVSQRPPFSSQAPRRQPAKGSGYGDAPWSVQQDRRRKALAAAARVRRAQELGVAPQCALRFQYDFASIFGVGRSSLTRLEAASSALRRLHTRAVKAMSFATAGDALITAGGDGQIQQLNFPIARARGTDGLAGRTLGGHTAAVTAVDANLSRQRPLILSGSADGCLRVWSPGARDTAIMECIVGGGSSQGARVASGSPLAAAQFFYLDKFVLSCAADALELRRSAADLSSSAPPPSSIAYDPDRRLSPVPLYKYSVGTGHSITSATALNHFASNLVFLATSEKEVQVLDVVANTLLWREGATHSRGIYRVATGRTSRYATPDVGSSAEHLFMSASLDSTAALWDVRMAKPVQLFTQHCNTGIPSLALEIAPGAGVVAVASQDNAVYVYDLRGGGGALALNVLRGFDSYATSLAWHPLRPVLVAGMASGDVHVFQQVT
ncbi:hypothetical protein LSCM1_03833 [Leishmania martiniquensis]|uniref:Guanine nucleotide-binding protein subunit beta-like protein n=1 Tax=Leishmania martiniquensis TaxID=1580590 RepID=A0A836GHU5_9TRYP|nr:hypothetical protein LSCM1_03833 [Leishmania martiniquensis]